jgi:carboxyl-terminal processing protease
MRKTDAGRIVYGGDGIRPDEKYETPKLTPLEASLSDDLVFFFYAPEFFAGRTGPPLAKEWTPDAKVLEDFRNFAATRGVVFPPADFTHDESWIRERLREELFITAFSKEDSDRLTFQNDPEVAKGAGSLPASKAMLDHAHEAVGSKKVASNAPVQ